MRGYVLAWGKLSLAPHSEDVYFNYIFICWVSFRRFLTSLLSLGSFLFSLSGYRGHEGAESVRNADREAAADASGDPSGENDP